MMPGTGFDNDRYIELQSAHISERIAQFGGKLYLEFGGKLFDDFHASRVLPGFGSDSKLRMLLQFRDDAEIVIAVNSEDIENNKIRGDIGITYDLEVLRLIDAFKAAGLYVSAVVLTKYTSGPLIVGFENKLAQRDMKVYRHFSIPDYPNNVENIVSENGYGKNDYIETTRKLVVVTAPGPGSGKMATCLSQLYNDNKRGIKAGYAKFETFPIWNLPLKHPVNLAYEAATADLDDVNMIDPYHLEEYGKSTVNYNRDIEIFPVLSAIFKRIYGGSPYRSPTDMGVNMAGFCITDDNVCREASNQEIIRRYYDTLCRMRENPDEKTKAAITKIESLLIQSDLSDTNRPVIGAALKKAEETDSPATSIMLPDGTIVTGKTSSLLGASSAALLNAIKKLANLNDNINLISRAVIEPVQKMKINHLGNHNARLHLDETLIALSICGATNDMAKYALDMLPILRGCEAHSTVILSQMDIATFKKLGINITCEPVYQVKKLYHG